MRSEPQIQQSLLKQKLIHNRKILVIGSKGVGKTSIIAGFIKGFLFHDASSEENGGSQAKFGLQGFTNIDNYLKN